MQSAAVEAFGALALARPTSSGGLRAESAGLMGDSDAAGDASHRNSEGWRSGAASIAIGVSIALIAGVAIRTSVNWLYAPLVGAGISYITYQIVTVVLRGRALRRKPALTAVDYEEGYKSLRGVMLGDDTTPHFETAALLLDTERERAFSALM